MPTSSQSSTLSADRRLAATIGKNTIFGMAARGVQIGTRLVMVPVVIHHFGLGGYGIWSIIMATAAYMRFGSAGLKSAFQKYVAEATGNGDFETANKLLSTGSISMLVLSLVLLIPISISSRHLALASGVPKEFLGAASEAISALALTMVIANFGAAFEAILMGANRIDLTRSFNIITTVVEALAILVLLHFGYGLFAMAVVMAMSELAYILYCYVVSRRVVPQIRIRIGYFTKSVFRELIRFAGSYQLVNVLEVLYVLLLPITMLKYFGAEIAGVYALGTRLITAVLMGQDALILPLLSGGAAIFVSGSPERLTRFFRKSFKITIAITLLPLAYVGAFGALLVLAWTGQTGAQISGAIWLLCLGGFFNSISRLQLILYRASGNALHDNIRQAFRLGALGALAVFGRDIGFDGVLLGLAAVELTGVVYMFAAMKSALSFFKPSLFVPDALRLAMATAAIIISGVAATMIPLPGGPSQRAVALTKLAGVSLACCISFWPAITLTRSISNEEKGAALNLLLPWRRAIPEANL